MATKQARTGAAKPQASKQALSAVRRQGSAGTCSDAAAAAARRTRQGRPPGRCGVDRAFSLVPPRNRNRWQLAKRVAGWSRCGCPRAVSR
jgi:hypothetical protein